MGLADALLTPDFLYSTMTFLTDAPLAQLDRALDFGSSGRGFESLRARQQIQSGHSFWSAHLSDQQSNVFMRVSFPGSGQEMTESPYGEGFAHSDVPPATACVACHPRNGDFSENGNDQGRGEI